MTTTTTTAKFERILALEDEKRRARASAVLTDRPSIECDRIFSAASDALDAAISDLTVEEILAYGEFRKTR